MPRKSRKRKNKTAARRAARKAREADQAAAAPGIDEGLLSLRGLDMTVRSYRIEPGTVDEGNRSVEGILATENPAMVFDLKSWAMVDEILLMGGMKIAEQIPFLDSHDRSSVSKQLGSARDLKVEGKNLVGRTYFSEVEEDAWVKVREGHVTDFSIGYRITGYVTIEAGTTAKVVGKNYTAPASRDLRVVTEWECKEVSLCPIGADSFAKVRAALGLGDDQRKQERKRRMNSFEKWLEQKDFALDELSDKQEEFLRSSFEAEEEMEKAEVVVTENPAAQTDPAAPAPAESDSEKAISEKAILAERKRVQDIREVARGIPLLDAETVQKCEKDGVDVDKAREIFLDKIRNRKATPVGNPQPERGEAELEDFDEEMLKRGFGTEPMPE